MKLKRVSIVMLAGAAVLLAPIAFADEDDKWKEHRHYSHKKKGKKKRGKESKEGIHYHYYYYHPRSTVGQSLDCPPPPAVTDRHAPPLRPQEEQRSLGKLPNGFPKESMVDRSEAKERQREILEKELATEQQLLAKAKRGLAEQESLRDLDDGDRRAQRLRPYMDNVELHERNVAALRRELSNLHR